MYVTYISNKQYYININNIMINIFSQNTMSTVCWQRPHVWLTIAIKWRRTLHYAMKQYLLKDLATRVGHLSAVATVISSTMQGSVKPASLEHWFSDGFLISNLHAQLVYSNYSPSYSQRSFKQPTNTYLSVRLQRG